MPTLGLTLAVLRVFALVISFSVDVGGDVGGTTVYPCCLCCSWRLRKRSRNSLLLWKGRIRPFSSGFLVGSVLGAADEDTSSLGWPASSSVPDFGTLLASGSDSVSAWGGCVELAAGFCCNRCDFNCGFDRGMATFGAMARFETRFLVNVDLPVFGTIGCGS